jgi:murein L,D-transpeptidase YcbB/YkuD
MNQVKHLILLGFIAAGTLSLPFRAMSLQLDNHELDIVPIAYHAKQIEDLYHLAGNQLIWHKANSHAAQQFEAELERIKRAGFSPFFSKQFDTLVKYREAAKWREYDVVATDTLIAYISYVELAPEKGREWLFEAAKLRSLPLPSPQSLRALYHVVTLTQSVNKPDAELLDSKIQTHSVFEPSDSPTNNDSSANDVLQTHTSQGVTGSRTNRTQSLDQLLSSYLPNTPDYHHMVESYEKLMLLEHQPVVEYVQLGTKRLGDTLVTRAALIDHLKTAGVDVSQVITDVDVYDQSLASAVRQFQKIHGLTMDGVIGKNTLMWVNLPVKKRLAMIAINLERLRIWARPSESMIVVNVPSFEMKYWAAGEEVFHTKVVVGKFERKTPLLNINLETVVVNPTWNIPYKIMVEDIIPKMKNDNSYLASHNIEIIEGWNSDKVIDPADIDWVELRSNTFPYRMRQQSGSYNALGQYKFNTPNRDAIYLHDTPSQSLFNRDSRAFSSGCIRVQNARSFAQTILSQQGIVKYDLNPEQSRSNTHVVLKSRIPVHIIYQTVWYEAGELNYRKDIYDYDPVSA